MIDARDGECNVARKKRRENVPDFDEIQRKQDEEHAAMIARIAAYVAEFKGKPS